MSTLYADKRGIRICLCFRIEFRTVDSQPTLAAFWAAGSTGVTSELNDPVAEIAAFFGRKDLPKLVFHLLRFLSVGKTEPSADSNAMGVTDNTSGLLI